MPQYPRGGQCAPPRGRGRYPARARGRGRGRIRKPMTPPSPPKKEKKAFPKAKMKLREGEEENDFSSMLMTMSSKAFSLASKEPKVKSSIRVLTCSANLGNAQPDDYSMDEWIPRDGDMRLVVQDEPIFPLFRTYEGKIQADMDKSRHMKIKELKKALTAKGIKTKQFVEKSEFLRAYVEAGGTAEPEEPVEEEQQQETNIEDADAELQDDAFDAFFATRATSHKKVADDGDPPGEKFREDDDYEAFLVAKDIVDNYEAFTAAVDADIDFDNLDDQNQDADYEFEADFDTEWSAFDNQPYEEEDQYEDERPAEHFDIIVIGMQEATFETEGVDDDFLNDENSDSGSEDDDDRTNESIGSLEEQDDLETPVETLSPMKSSKSKNLSGKVLSASLKAGKAALKAGAKVGSKTVKVGNKTLKTAAAAKTLITEYNHTKKSAPTPQQAATPMMDGGKSDWNDTAVLHFLFDGQLPSYERALSYQLGEMRLMVYYRESAVDVNLLSVKTQATGKHGLANKGGIVAEVAVNQSTRLAFMTAHLEAHVSLQSLLNKSMKHI